ncbi:hypothetical protein NPA07_00815 [Mycoplasmopsis caviae]|uniref:Uncharacterized protein n=1 Tax=Mycoplasmopsis caviae TaxID=55603 RepID=A0ABY5J3L1_9BACT|nr:hypothetical protein [Mycoplasmopsis caviae]UUD35404.1 hypothetical protein NPA07_00815 [Mycoplasmopsis caviae]
MELNKEPKSKGKKVVITHSSTNPDEYIETIKYVSSWKPMSIVFFLPEDHQNVITNFIKNTIFESNILIYGKEVEGLNWIKIDEENSFHHLTTRFISYIDKGEKIVFVEDVKLTEEQKNKEESVLNFHVKEVMLNMKFIH